MEETFITKEQQDVLVLYKKRLFEYLLGESEYGLKKHLKKIIREIVKVDEFLEELERSKEQVYNLELNK